MGCSASRTRAGPAELSCSTGTGRGQAAAIRLRMLKQVPPQEGQLGLDGPLVAAEEGLVVAARYAD